MARLSNGTVLGERFEILGVLGEGGMAVVYLADDRLRGERVALKLLHRHLASSPSMRERLRREVLASGRVRHPHALVAYELHELDGSLGLSMPVCAGQTLADEVAASGPLSAERLWTLGQQLASALAHAHGHGVLHRDITPTNVMLDAQGNALLTDFGLARLDAQRTATATAVLGTAGYAAPEVYEGVRGDPRSDLYGLGAVLYLAATGEAPFGASSAMASLKRQIADDRVPLARARPDLPAGLVAQIEAMLAPTPDARPQGAAEVAEAFASRQAPEVAPAPPASTVTPLPVGVTPTLPGGDWSVVVEETERVSPQRRARLRAGLDPHGEGWEGAFRRLVSELADGVLTALSMPTARPPEERLAAGIARLAMLPEDAIAPKPALLEPRFVLVDGVDKETAEGARLLARELGFSARLARDQGLERTRRFAFEMAGSLVAAVAAFVAGLALVGPEPWVFMSFFVLAGILFTIASVSFLRRGAQPERLLGPIAYSANLRGALSERYEPEVAASTASTTQAPTLPTLPERVGAQIDALARAIDAHADDLAAPILGDLRRTLKDLRAQRDALVKRLDRLKVRMASSSDADAADAVARIEARLERLHALEQLGTPIDPEERHRLVTALDAHRETLAAQEALEADHTRALARLLELGAAAARARRALARTDDLGGSATDILAKLEGQVSAARAASAEVAETDPDADRKRRARAAAAAKLRH